MSYSITVTPHQPPIYDTDITINLRDMFAEGGLRLPELNGMDTRAARYVIKRCLVQMVNDPARFKRHNPANRWGNYETAVQFLQELLDACEYRGKVEVTW